MPLAHIYLFGNFEVKLDTITTNYFETTSARALCAYLAFHAPQAQAREHLAALLWGADAGATRLTNLRSCIRRVRQALGDQEGSLSPFLHIERETIRFNPQTAGWVDVQRFEASLTAVKAHRHRHLQSCPWCIARLTEAAALYRGPLLADLDLKSSGFEEWQLAQRERLHRRAMQLLHCLADYHQQRGAYPEAEEYARRQLVLEPWNEEAHQQLMRSLYASGQRSAALAQYKRCRQLLHEQLEVEPSTATTTLYQWIRQGRELADQPMLLPTTQANKGHNLPLTPSNNLPTPATPLIDRTAELDWLLFRLTAPEHRLVTLVGEGGVGKTRLALAAAHMLGAAFRDGVWFVPLADLPAGAAPADQQAQLSAAIVAALEIHLDQEHTPRQQLLRYLRDKELLLVLDTFEHLLAGGGLVSELLQRAPRLTLLVTARQPLILQAQHLLRLEGLACAPSDQIGEGGLSPGVQLFVARARQWQPNLRLPAAHLAAVTQICQFVRGLPLAIELAAGLLPQMLPDVLANNLRQGLDLLVSEQVDLPVRHRNLRLVFAWSWQLLTPALQQLLGQLALLPDGFTAEIAQAGAGATPALLTALVERSLLQVDATGRYYLHDLLRAFAAEKLGVLSQAKLTLHLGQTFIEHGDNVVDLGVSHH